MGKLYKKVKEKTSGPLPLRECNKIIHAKNLVLARNKTGSPFTRYLKPKVFCYDDFQQQTGYKAEIDLLSFVEHSDALIGVL